MSDGKKRTKGRPANYGDATPEQVGAALLRFRPKGRYIPDAPTLDTETRAGEHRPPVNPSL